MKYEDVELRPAMVELLGAPSQLQCLAPTRRLKAQGFSQDSGRYLRRHLGDSALADA